MINCFAISFMESQYNLAFKSLWSGSLSKLCSYGPPGITLKSFLVIFKFLYLSFIYCKIKSMVCSLSLSYTSLQLTKSSYLIIST